MLQYFMFDKSCKNLLVRGVNWIGDGVMTLPALRALRKSLPATRISLLVKPWVSQLFENDPDIDEIIIYGDEYEGVIGKIKLSRLLNKKKFCSAILFQNAFDAALITFLAGIKERAGYKRDYRGCLLTNAVTVSKNDRETHQINYYLSLLERLRIKADYSDPYIYLRLDERLRARNRFESTQRPILGISPGATYGSAKRWLPERFAEIMNWFVSDTGGSAVIFGSKSETAIADEILKKVIPEFRTSRSLLNLAGKTSLRELISLISECDVFVTNDSGSLHIAYAVRTPLVAIFGSTDPSLTGPPHRVDGDDHIIIKPDLLCSPCFERTCKQNDFRCMYAVTSDEVYYGIKKLLPETAAVFFDRDGTLCKDSGYINKYADLQIFAGVDDLRLLKERGFRLIGVSNQSGIAKGIVDEEFVRIVNRMFIEKFGFDDFNYCPHNPDDHCPCRKPEPGMVFRARARHRINLKKSFIVGDKEADMILARAIGAKSILVQTGEAKESEYADCVAKNLTEAVNWILENEKS